MKTRNIILLSILGVILLIGLDFGFGYLGVFKTKTVIKAQRTATKEVERKVFETSQSYVEGKRQEATKYRLEYMQADSSSKKAIQMFIVQSFANFDLSLLNDPVLEAFIKNMKYNNY